MIELVLPLENPLKMTGGTGAGSGSGQGGTKISSEFADTPEERVKMLERKVMERLEQSYLAAPNDFREKRISTVLLLIAILQ